MCLNFLKSYQYSLQRWAEDPDAKNVDDEQDEEDKDRLIDENDEFALQKARAKDDWKDGNLNNCKFIILKF